MSGPHEISTETIIHTPRPSACSTVDKRLVQRNFGRQLEEYIPSMSDNSKDESLGLLSLKSDNSNLIDNRNLLSPNLESYKAKVREDAIRVLEECGKRKMGLPSKYLTPTETKNNTDCKGANASGSTISESDLLRESLCHDSKLKNYKSNATREISHFIDKSNQEQFSNVDIPLATTSYSKTLEEMSAKFRNSEISLKDLCGRLSRSANPSKSSLFSDDRLEQTEDYNKNEKTFEELRSKSFTNLMDMYDRLSDSVKFTSVGATSDLFTPAELAGEKLKQDELSWRNKRGLPQPAEERPSLLSQFSADTREKYSMMSEFFRAGNANMSDIFSQVSPEKTSNIAPLVDNSYLSDAPVKDKACSDSRMSIESSRHEKSSLISVTEIAKLLAESESLSPNKVLNYLTKKTKKNEKETGKDLFQIIDSTFNDVLSKSCKYTSEFEPPQHSTFTEDAMKTDDNNFTNKQVTTLKESEFSPVACSSTRRSLDSKTYISPNANHMASTKLVTDGKISLTPTYDMKSPVERGNCLSSDKENDSQNVQSQKQMLPNKKTRNSDPSDCDRSISSVRSGSSLDTLVNGKLPIKSSKCELVWGCVKVGKNVARKFSLRNKSHKKIRFQMQVSGSAYRIAKSDTEHISSTTVLLHPMETKAVTIMFSPTTIGPCVEKLTFIPNGNIVDHHGAKQIVRLYGYGGQSAIEIKNVSKDPSGRSWLSLGVIENVSAVSENMIFVNNGSISAFVHITFVAKEQYRYSSVVVEPTTFILQPNEEINVSTTYNLNKEDFNGLRNLTEVLELGSLKITYGEEPTRARIRRVCKKLKQSENFVDPLMEAISECFPKETPVDVSKFAESTSSMEELLRNLNFREIIVTVEQNLEKTLLVGIDETSMFETLCLDKTGDTCLENTLLKAHTQELYKLEPSMIVLTPPIKEIDTFLLSSSVSTLTKFEVLVEPTESIEVVPRTGMISSEEMVLLKVSCRNIEQKNFQTFKVKIFIDNEVLELDVKVIFINKRGFK